MIRLSMRQLLAVRELAATRSFTAAASRLHTTQSNVSAAIQDAEHLLGVKLFHRTTRSVDLTGFGEEFAERLAPMLDGLETCIDEIQAGGRLARGQLALGVTPLLGSTMIPQVLAEFHAAHPHLLLRVEDGETAALRSLLASRTIELAIGTFEGENAELAVTTLFDDELVVLSHPEMQLQRTIPWAALPSLPVVSINSASSVGRIMESTMDRIGGERIQPIVQSRHWLTVVSMAASLKALCVVPRYATALRTRWRMRLSRLVDPVVKRPIGMVSIKGRHLSPAGEQFSKLLTRRV